MLEDGLLLPVADYFSGFKSGLRAAELLLLRPDFKGISMPCRNPMDKAIVRKFSKLSIVIAAGLTLAIGQVAFGAETLRLDEQGQWQKAADSNDQQYLLRVAEIKKLVDEGKPDKVKKAVRQLKKDFPGVAGKDFDSFMNGEVLLASGKVTKAMRQYDKFLDDYPSSTLRDAAIARQFEMAMEYLNGRKKTVLFFRVSAFDDGVKMMEKVSDRMGNADIAKRALVSVARAYEKRKQYNEAYLKWSEISLKWPTGEIARDALLAMAKNKYDSFNGPAFDASSLISARTYYENFRLRYPEEAKKLNIDEIFKRIDEQLAEKNLLIARYYERTGSTGPANMYYRMVTDKWPDTQAAQTARQKISQK